MDQATKDYYDVTQYRYEAEGVISKVDVVWSMAYNVIANINYILENLDVYSENVTPPVYERIKGECLGLRAYIHLDLLRLFAWGNLKERPELLERLSIPYATRYTKDLIPQSSVGDVLQYIADDLNEAEKLLPPDATASRFTFTYYALLATHMRLAMWEGDYGVARHYAEMLLAFETDFPWVSASLLNTNTPEARDLTFSSEYLFGLDIDKFIDITEQNFEARLVENQTNPQYLYHSAETAKALYEVEEEIGMGDYRYRYWYDLIGVQYPFLKYKQYENGNYGNRVPLIKKAEIYYTLSECLNESGNSADRQQAITYLNTVRANRNIVQKLESNLTKEEVQEEIFKEWRKEMLLEGQMFFYYKRRGESQIPGSNIVMNDATYVLPLPMDEIEFGGRENTKK